ALPQGGDRKRLMNYMVGYEPDLVELLEVRLGLECNAVALAARRATDEDIRALEKHLNAMAEALASGDIGSSSDLSFHMAIAFASKNNVQIHIMKSLYDMLFFGIEENLLHLYSNPQDLQHVFNQHKAVLEAIRSHNPDAALEAMKRHI